MVILFLIRSRAKERLEERERVQAALEDANRRYERIVSTEHVGIWELDEQGNTSFVNHRMAAMLGYTTDEMLRRPMYDFMDEEERAQASQNLNGACNRSKSSMSFDFDAKTVARYGLLSRPGSLSMRRENPRSARNHH